MDPVTVTPYPNHVAGRVMYPTLSAELDRLEQLVRIRRDLLFCQEPGGTDIEAINRLIGRQILRISILIPDAEGVET